MVSDRMDGAQETRSSGKCDTERARTDPPERWPAIKLITLTVAGEERGGGGRGLTSSRSANMQAAYGRMNGPLTDQTNMEAAVAMATASAAPPERKRETRGRRKTKEQDQECQVGKQKRRIGAIGG